MKTVLVYLSLLCSALPAWAFDLEALGPLLASASHPPTWPVVRLHAAPCANGEEGQQVIAYHAAQGQLHGCWGRTLGRVIIHWDDGDFSAFPAAAFFPKTGKT